MPSPFALPGRPRSAGRLARGPALTAAFAARLTARDRWLLRMIHEHRVLTTGQITQLAFGTTRAANARMTTLYRYRAVDRFRPLAAAGSSPLHYILDEAGATLLTAEDGITLADLGYRGDRAMGIALSPRLSHDVGANGVFTALAAAARASGGQAGSGDLVVRAALRRRLGRPRPPRRLRPLGEQLPGRPAAVTDFFLEYDTGTESLARLVGKLAGYAALAARTGITTPVLFCLRSPRREAALHARLAGPPPPGARDAASASQIPGVPVATAVPGSSPEGPAGAAWLPAGGPGPRRRLAQLAPPSPARPAGTPADETPGVPLGGLAWHPPSPVPPAWHALPGESLPGEPADD